MTRIIGVYENEQEVIEKIQKFKAEGIDPGNFSVLARDDNKTQLLADELNVKETKDEQSHFFSTLGTFFAGVASPVTTSISSGSYIGAGPMAAALLGRENDDLRGLLGTLELNEGLIDNYIKELDEGKILLFLES